MEVSIKLVFFLFFPQMPAMLVPLTEELLPLTFLQAKTSLGGPRCQALADSPSVIPQELPAGELSPGPLPKP